jgi:hypothetical protein
MAHSSPTSARQEQLHLGVLAPKLVVLGALLAILGLGTGVGLWATHVVDTQAFFHAYLLAVTYFIVISLGALFFVMLQHLTRAGWSVSVRRLAELLAASLPVLMVFLVPVLVLIWQHNPALHVWADPHFMAHEEALQKKAGYFAVNFFLARFALYAACWAVLSRYFLGRSTLQDTQGDLGISYQMQWVAAPATAVFALTMTFFVFDFVMSLEPTFYSTVFGVYVFAGAYMSINSLLVLMVKGLQGRGILAKSVHTEHFHDLGKMMFGFVFFWGYIGFSQYMLIWYGNIPEETQFFMLRQTGDWTYVSLALLFGHLLLPFPGLLSKHVKRKGKVLVAWALWLLAMEYLDLYWLIMPSGALQHGPEGHMVVAHGPRFGLLEISLWVGMAGIFLVQFVLRAKRYPLRPLKDPRLEESLAFENA